VRQLRKSAFWTVAAILLWLLAMAVDRRTAVEVYSDGGRVHLDVAGTSLSAPLAINRLTAIEIQAADSIDPPGGCRITVSTGDRDVISERLPYRFRLPRGSPVPLGDWELDDSVAAGTVWRKEIDIAGPFTVRATFHGRFLSDQNLILAGKVRALLNGRYNVSYDDIRYLAKPVLRHRILLNFQAEAERVDVDKVIEELLASVAESR
jgi:hypothetical protein